MSKTRLTNPIAPGTAPVSSKRDDVLRRLLETPPQPHVPPAIRKSCRPANSAKTGAHRELGEHPSEDDDGR
jgi:hypothetical protein